MADKLGIIAGSGDLPRMLIEACRESGRECHVIALEGHADPDVVKDVPHDGLRLGAAGKAIEIGRALNVRDVVLAGGIERPSLSSLRPDWRTLQFIMRLGRKSLGDDGILRLVIAEFEAEGFRVIGPDTVLQDLKPEAGLLGSHAPDQTAEDDIARGRDVLRSMSAADIGQAVVVQQGLVLGVEAIEGTDALLARCGPLRREGDGGVLIKLSTSATNKPLNGSVSPLRLVNMRPSSPITPSTPVPPEIQSLPQPPMMSSWSASPKAMSSPPPT